MDVIAVVTANSLKRNSTGDAGHVSFEDLLMHVLQLFLGLEPVLKARKTLTKVNQDVL